MTLATLGMGIEPTIDPLPWPTARRDRAIEHNAGDRAELRTALVAGHAGDEMGNPEPGRNERCGPERNPTW